MLSMAELYRKMRYVAGHGITSDASVPWIGSLEGVLDLLDAKV
jgi:hypothetical protein